MLPRELTPLEIKQAALDYDHNSLRLPLEALETRQCRWPVNDPEPKGQYLFCGHHRRPASATASTTPPFVIRPRSRNAATPGEDCNQLHYDGQPPD